MDNRPETLPQGSPRRLLDAIDNPRDLKKLPPELLPQLAQEIREEIISTVSRTGGHLAPSLGVVELTIALQYVFDCPRDKIIWDVGHQAYAHKLLTGRRERFRTLRQFGGLSGFPKRSESPYDALDTGHAATSISAALGMAAARCLKREPKRIVAVIGDGAMTAGMAFEALNNAGGLDKDLIVILNDNGMSISPNVGAIVVLFQPPAHPPRHGLLEEPGEGPAGISARHRRRPAALGQEERRLFKGLLHPGYALRVPQIHLLGAGERPPPGSPHRSPAKRQEAAGPHSGARPHHQGQGL